ncbi:hypothetical protein [Nocardia tengchongensis]
MAFELGEEHSCLRLLGIRIGHLSPESANSGNQLLCRHPLDEQRHEVTHRPPLETAVKVGNDTGDDPRADSGKLVGKPPDEFSDLLILIICCHGSWSPAPLHTVNRREFDWGSMSRSAPSGSAYAVRVQSNSMASPHSRRLRDRHDFALTVLATPVVGRQRMKPGYVNAMKTVDKCIAERLLVGISSKNVDRDAAISSGAPVSIQLHNAADSTVGDPSA